MLSYLHLTSFKVFNIFLLFVFSVVVNNNLPLILSTTFYCIFYLFIIYLGIFYLRKSLFLIFFIYGLLLDIFLLNEIGPHLLIFIITLFLLNFFSRFLYSLSSMKVYLFIIFLLIMMIFFQMLFSFIFINISLNFMHLFQILIITVVVSYPIFLFFDKLDKFR